MILVERLSLLLADLLREDETRVLLGEDILDGTALGLSRDVIADSELCVRALPCPLNPATLIAHAGGLALAGKQPIVLYPGCDGLIDAYAALHELAHQAEFFASEATPPLVLVIPYGPGFGDRVEAALAPDTWLAALPNVSIFCAGEAEHASEVLASAIRTSPRAGICAVLLPREILVAQCTETRTVPAIYRHADGEDVTVFCWGTTVAPAKAAAQQCRSQGRGNARVVELVALQPLAMAEIAQSVSAGGRVVICQHGSGRGGVAAELAAGLADVAILHLDAPITRVCAPTTGIRSEYDVVPSLDSIANAIAQVTSY